jgi:hypothetical protein
MRRVQHLQLCPRLLPCLTAALHVFECSSCKLMHVPCGSLWLPVGPATVQHPAPCFLGHFTSQACRQEIRSILATSCLTSAQLLHLAANSDMLLTLYDCLLSCSAQCLAVFRHFNRWALELQGKRNIGVFAYWGSIELGTINRNVKRGSYGLIVPSLVDEVGAWACWVAQPVGAGRACVPAAIPLLAWAPCTPEC